MSSTAPGSSNFSFQVQATSFGRERGASRTLPGTGTVETAKGVAWFVRFGSIVEYSVSVDGLQQDFVLPEPPQGQGTLRVELEVTDAKVAMVGTLLGGVRSSQRDDSTCGAQLVLESGRRKVNYHRLRAVDSTGGKLAAWMEVIAPTQLALMVEDGGAVYPVRIDPTFGDANWTSMGGFPGADYVVAAAVVDSLGNLYIGGHFTIVGDIFANNITKWNGNRTWGNQIGMGILTGGSRETRG